MRDATTGRWFLNTFHHDDGVLLLSRAPSPVVEIWLESERLAAPVILHVFHPAVSEAPAVAEDGVPWDFAWKDTDKPLSLGGTAQLRCDTTLRLGVGERPQCRRHMLRTLGGKAHEQSKPLLADLRGGYSFAPSDSVAPSLVGAGGGIKHERQIASVELSVNGDVKNNQRLLLAYPEGDLEDWMFDAHAFRLRLSLRAHGREWSVPGPSIHVPAYEFRSDWASSEARLDLLLQSEYGNTRKRPPLHARAFKSCVAGGSRVANRLSEHLGTVAAAINAGLPASAGFSVLENEIACVFLSEGAVSVVRRAAAGGLDPDRLRFDGYNDLGIDSYVTAWKNNQGLVRTLTPDSLGDLIARKKNIKAIVNEKHHHFETFTNLGLLDAVHSVAVLYADAKYAFAMDLADTTVMGPWRATVDRLPRHVQSFWATLYYNTGLQNGHNTLRNRGVEYHDLIWDKEDDHSRYARFEKFNANWRTASFRLLERALSP